MQSKVGCVLSINGLQFQAEKQGVLNPSQYQHHTLPNSWRSDLKYWPSTSRSGGHVGLAPSEKGGFFFV